MGRDFERDAAELGKVVELAAERPPATPPDLLTMGEFLEAEFPARVPVLGPLASASLAHISGATGVGKTNMALGLSKAIGTGTDWAHWKSHEQRIVLHVDGEMPPVELQQRMRSLGLGPQAHVFPLSAIWLADEHEAYGHINLAEVAWQQVIEHYITYYGVSVLQLDNVMSLMHVEGVSMASDEYWRPVMGWLRRLRGRGLTVIVWDHTNAEGRTFGTKTKEWQADLVINLTAPELHDPGVACVFELQVSKSRGLHGTDVAPATISVDGRGVAHAVPIESPRQRVDALLLGGMSVREVASETGVSKSAVGRRRKALEGQIGDGFGDD